MSEEDETGENGDPREDLWLAVCEGDHVLIESIVEDRPDLARGRTDEGLPWTLAAVYRGHPGVADLLLRHGAELDTFTAAALGRTDQLAVLFDRGADLAARSQNEIANTPLHAAIAGGRNAVAELLVERGADVNAVANGLRPLDIAAGREDDEMVTYLVEHGAVRGEAR